MANFFLAGYGRDQSRSSRRKKSQVDGVDAATERVLDQ